MSSKVNEGIKNVLQFKYGQSLDVWKVPTGISDPLVVSSKGQISTSLWVLLGPGMPKSACGMCVLYVLQQWLLPGDLVWLRRSLPPHESEPIAEEMVIKSVRRIGCFLALRSRSLRVKVEAQKLRNLPDSNVSFFVDKSEMTSISMTSNIVSWQVLSYHSSRYAIRHRKQWMTDICFTSSAF